MTLQVHTARIDYPGPDRLDITAKSGDGTFAPTWDIIVAAKRGDLSWPDYVERYTQLMRQSYRSNREVWDLVLASPRVVLVCYCKDPAHCHRTVLARILTRLGARYYGEITEWDETVEEPLFAGRRG
jgi:uncharacterized protein YeaO (DUF488 family)